MPMINFDGLSEFAKTALALDEEFNKFEKLGRELEGVSVQSDKGMDRTQTLLDELAACRTRMAGAMQMLSQRLVTSRERCELAEEIIVQRNNEAKARQAEAAQMVERFKALGTMVQTVTSTLAELKKSRGMISEEDRNVILKEFPDFNEKIGLLVDESQRLVDQARASNMKSMERDADSLKKSLQLVQNRFNLFVEKQNPNPASLH